MTFVLDSICQKRGCALTFSFQPRKDLQLNLAKRDFSRILSPSEFEGDKRRFPLNKKFRSAFPAHCVKTQEAKTC